MRLDLAMVAAGQRGVFTRGQALRWYTRREIEHRLAAGRWQRLFRGTYTAAADPVDSTTLALAAWLAVGKQAVIGLETAAALHGFGVLDDGLVHLVTPRGSDGLDQPGLRVTTAHLGRDDITTARGVPCTAPARTAVDLARLRPRLDALPVLDATLRSGLVTADTLAGEVAAHAGLRGVIQARELLPLADPRVESPMESRLRLVLHDAGLPRPTPQLWVPDEFGRPRYRLDLGWEQRRIGAEYDGDGHRDRMQLRHDRERHNWLAGRGWEIRYFTDLDVYRRPAYIAATLRLALARPAA
jgi:hypothetical protein